MNAIMVSVDYDDILRVTLPYNRHHYSRVLVVTSLTNYNSVLKIAEPLNVEVYATNSFYNNGAVFNKWLAMEEGLEILGKDGWICVRDVDVLWPRDLKCTVENNLIRMEYQGRWWAWSSHHLITPLRRMYPGIPDKAPEESTWRNYPLHHYNIEWGGYSQIFHASDPVLRECAMCGHPPETHPIDHKHAWYQTNWKHAGGADSFLQMRWSMKNKIRPPWECLHLGESGKNWHGRISRMADGTLPINYHEHKKSIEEMYHNRRLTRGRDNYNNPIEKIL